MNILKRLKEIATRKSTSTQGNVETLESNTAKESNNLAIGHLQKLRYLLDIEQSEHEIEKLNKIEESCKRFQKDNDIIPDGKLNSITKYTLYSIVESSELNLTIRNYIKNNKIDLSLKKVQNSIKNLVRLQYLNEFSEEDKIKSACMHFQKDRNCNIDGIIDQKIYELLEKIINLESPLDHLRLPRDHKKANTTKKTSQKSTEPSSLLLKLGYLSEYEYDQFLIEEAYKKFQKDIGISQTGIQDNCTVRALESAEGYSALFNCLKEYKKSHSISSICQPIFMQEEIRFSSLLSKFLLNNLLGLNLTSGFFACIALIFAIRLFLYISQHTALSLFPENISINTTSINTICTVLIIEIPTLFILIYVVSTVFRLSKSLLLKWLNWNDLEQLRISVNQLNSLGYVEAKDITSYEDIEDACKHFQDNIGLKQDGILGPKTQAALWKSESPLLSLFFPSKVTLHNIQDIKIVTRKRETAYRFYLLFLLSFLGIILTWPFISRLLNFAGNLLSGKIKFSDFDRFQISLKELFSYGDLFKALDFNNSVGDLLIAFLSILPALFIISFLSERAIEILLTTAFGWDKDSIVDQILFYENLANFLSDNPNAFLDEKSFPGNLMQQREYSKNIIPKFLQKINELKKVLSNCNAVAKKVAYATSFSLGLLSAFSGVRLIEPLLLAENLPTNLQLHLLRWIDILLTGILISGGSEVAHRLYKGTIDFSIFTQLLKGGASNITNSISSIIPGSRQPAFPRESSENRNSR